jgi:hypothetical protein
VINLKAFKIMVDFVQTIAGQAVIKAAANGALFSLHKRDVMLDYIMALMASRDSNFSHTELQYTQVTSYSYQTPSCPSSIVLVYFFVTCLLKPKKNCSP